MKTKVIIVLALGLAMVGSANADLMYHFDNSGTSSGGNAISAKADVTISAGMVTIKLENTTLTANTTGAAELLTGFDFELAGFAAGTLSTATTPESINISNAEVVSTAGAANLLTVNGGGATWSLINGATLRLVFNPDAKYGIIGPAMNANAPNGSTYPNAGASIENNSHEPLSYRTADFTILIPNLPMDTALSHAAFRFGSEFETTIVTPEPASAGVLMLVGAGMIGTRGFGRRRS